MLTSVTYAPPTPSPGETTTTPSPTTTTTTVPMTQLPTTGTSETASGALWIGIAVLVLGAALLAVVLRHRRLRTG